MVEWNDQRGSACAETLGLGVDSRVMSAGQPAFLSVRSVPSSPASANWEHAEAFLSPDHMDLDVSFASTMSINSAPTSPTATYFECDPFRESGASSLHQSGQSRISKQVTSPLGLQIKLVAPDGPALPSTDLRASGSLVDSEAVSFSSPVNAGVQGSSNPNHSLDVEGAYPMSKGRPEGQAQSSGMLLPPSLSLVCPSPPSSASKAKSLGIPRSLARSALPSQWLQGAGQPLPIARRPVDKTKRHGSHFTKSPVLLSPASPASAMDIDISMRVESGELDVADQHPGSPRHSPAVADDVGGSSSPAPPHRPHQTQPDFSNLFFDLSSPAPNFTESDMHKSSPWVSKDPFASNKKRRSDDCDESDLPESAGAKILLGHPLSSSPPSSPLAPRRHKSRCIERSHTLASLGVGNGRVLQPPRASLVVKTDGLAVAPELDSTHSLRSSPMDGIHAHDCPKTLQPPTLRAVSAGNVTSKYIKQLNRVQPPNRRAFSAVLPPAAQKTAVLSDIRQSSTGDLQRRTQAGSTPGGETSTFKPILGVTPESTTPKRMGSRAAYFRHSAQAVSQAVNPSPKLPPFALKEADRKALPCHKVREDGLMRLTTETLIGLLSGAYDKQVSDFLVIDCRFDYEYQGGHVPGAVNLNTDAAIEEYFLSLSSNLPLPSQSGDIPRPHILVFHCEFSVKRAPTFAANLRSKDRSRNMSVYPKLHYPELYILEGGYSGFFGKYPRLCEPSGYVRMDDKPHAKARATALNDFRRWERTRSYTFGDQSLRKHVIANSARPMSQDSINLKQTITCRSRGPAEQDSLLKRPALSTLQEAQVPLESSSRGAQIDTSESDPAESPSNKTNRIIPFAASKGSFRPPNATAKRVRGMQRAYTENLLQPRA